MTRQLLSLFLIFFLTACASSGGSQVQERHQPEEVSGVAGRSADSLIKVGEGFERSGDIRGAISLYNQALAKDPAHLGARQAVARLLFRAGQVEEGLAELRVLRDFAPENDEVLLMLASAEVQFASLEEAAKTLAPLRAADDQSARFLALYGRIQQALDNPSEARSAFSSLMAQEGGKQQGTELMALSFALERKFDTAVALISSLKSAEGGGLPPRSQETLAVIYAVTGMPEASQEILTGLLPAEEINARRSYYELLLRLPTEERAFAVMFEQVRRDALSGLDP